MRRKVPTIEKKGVGGRQFNKLKPFWRRKCSYKRTRGDKARNKTKQNKERKKKIRGGGKAGERGSKHDL